MNPGFSISRLEADGLFKVTNSLITLSSVVEDHTETFPGWRKHFVDLQAGFKVFLGFIGSFQIELDETKLIERFEMIGIIGNNSLVAFNCFVVVLQETMADLAITKEGCLVIRFNIQSISNRLLRQG